MKYQAIIENRASILIYNFLSLLKQPKKFVLPVNICPIVPLVFIRAGVEFEFVDIDPETLCLDIQLALDIILNAEGDLSRKGILFVRTYGFISDRQTRDLKFLRENYPDLIVIDDWCLCAPKYCKQTEYSDLEVYSTGYSKYVDLGFGGYGFLEQNFGYKSVNTLIDDRRLPSKSSLEVKLLESLNFTKANNKREYEWLKKGAKPDTSFDLYMDRIQQQITPIATHKSCINTVYRRELHEVLCFGDEYNEWRFNIFVQNTNQLITKIFQSGLYASTHYDLIIECEKRFPIASNLRAHVINLFNDQHFCIEQAHLISEIINGHVAHNKSTDLFPPPSFSYA